MAKVLRRLGTEVTLEVTVDLRGTLLEMEGAIQEASNAVGRCATEEALRRFDTDGSPLRVGAMKLTARGRDPKDDQSPYGVVRVEIVKAFRVEPSQAALQCQLGEKRRCTTASVFNGFGRSKTRIGMDMYR